MHPEPEADPRRHGPSPPEVRLPRPNAVNEMDADGSPGQRPGAGENETADASGYPQLGRGGPAPVKESP